MRLRQEYKKEKRQFLVENTPIVSINFRALTTSEQNVLKVLFESTRAISNYELYYQFIRKQVDGWLHIVCASPTTRSKELLDSEVDAHFSKDFAVVANKNPVKLAEHYNKKFEKVNFEPKIPAFITIRRMLEDFVRVGWVGKRRTKNRTLYFLTEPTAKKLSEQMGWQLPKISL